MRSKKNLVGLCLAFALMSFGIAQNAINEIITEEKVVSSPVPFTTIYEFSRDVGKGRIIEHQKGKAGEVRKTFRIEKSPDGKELSCKLVSTEKVEATPRVMRIGKSGYATSRGSFTGRKVLTMESTAYLPSAGLKRPTFKTKMGIRAAYGVVAVDPKVIPLGTHLYIEGYGFAYACDTGGAIKGNKIDVCIEDARAVRQWGRRKVKVHILSAR